MAPTSAAPGSPTIAVLGAGITGLTSAFCLRKKFPRAAITVYERASQIGGCISTRSVDIGAGKHVLFETGPRTIRLSPGDPTAALFHKAGLFKSKSAFTTKSSPAALNRFIYYPDHIVKLPGPSSSLFSNLKTLLTEPLFERVVWSILREPFQPSRGSNADESVASFLTRRFGPELADNVVSAVFHGIYAGDIHQLSAKALMPAMVAREERDKSLTSSLFTHPPGSLVKVADIHTRRVLQESGLYNLPLSKGMLDAEVSTWSFHEGFGNMVDQLAKKMKDEMAISFKLNSPASHLRLSKAENKMETVIRTAGKDTTHLFDYVISTIPAHRLAEITTETTTDKNQPQSRPILPSLAQISTVKVMVVNLYFSQKVLPIEGFGYLIPQTVPFHQNPEFALGVLFDSYATPNMKDQSGVGTKVTVMLGGHWWDSWVTLPTEAEATQMAQDVLLRHLGISEKALVTHARLHQDGIPQYKVAHHDRLVRAHQQLRSNFKGRLKVAGQSYLGVGVNACVASGAGIATKFPNGGKWEEQTGLEAASSWFDVLAGVEGRWREG